MGRKRKALIGSITTAKEDDTSNACPETTNEEKILSDGDPSLETMEAMNVETTERPNSSYMQPKKKTSKVPDVAVRRSTRIKTSVSRSGTQKVESVVEFVNLVENEKNKEVQGEQVTTTIDKEDNTSNACLETPCEEKIHSEVESEKKEATQVQPVSTLQASNEIKLGEEEPQIHELNTVQAVIQSNLEEKVDYIVRAVDEFKSKDTELQNEGPSTGMNYKSLYMNAQRKVEEMMDKNFELVRKLEFALGKIEAYEKVIVGPKEMMLVPSQAKASTEVLNPQMIQRGISITDNEEGADVQNQKAASPKQKKKYQNKKGKP
ncbi:hypothetical protein ACJIZ3_016735 [Penstemon smallii]|uniref:Uncharacterized protein n=1 Tax=Penstemon smallii TaxID=265156 RepID=A0ABD3STX8_9LAMI